MELYQTGSGNKENRVLFETNAKPCNQSGLLDQEELDTIIKKKFTDIMEQLDAEINSDLESFRTIALLHRDLDEELITQREETTNASSDHNNETVMSSRLAMSSGTCSERVIDSRECTSRKSVSSTGTHALEKMEKEILKLKDELGSVRN